MSILKIKIYGEPVLKEKAEEVKDINKDIKKLAQNMFNTMHKFKGIGLAANQVGVLKRMIVIDTTMQGEEKQGIKFALINPKIISSKGKVKGEEGCLSFPGINTEIARALEITVEGIDLQGRKINIDAEGLLSRVLQHEIDHLDGVLFVDHISIIKRLPIQSKLNQLKRGL